jgi:pheromone shutdown-related protein TraB
MKITDYTSENDSAVARLQDEDGRQFIIVGVGAIGGDTSELAALVIGQEQPDSVCVDLDAARAKILTDEENWESLSLGEVIKEKLLTALLLNLLLAAYQRKLDDSSRAMPGAELHEALSVSERLSIPIILADRDLNITFSRASHSINYLEKFKLLLLALKRLIRYKKDSDVMTDELMEADVLSLFFGEVVESQPALSNTLIEERDHYTAQKMIASSGNKILAVVGVGRVSGIRRTLLEGHQSQAANLEDVPVTSPISKWGKRILPILIVLGLIYLAWSQGKEFIRESLGFWIAANSLLTGLGAVLAGAHILAVITAIIVAPISPLIPAGPGTVAAIVQLLVRPPLVKDFQTFADDISHLLQWRKNRILKVLLVLILCGLGSIIGTVLATSKILLSLLSLD